MKDVITSASSSHLRDSSHFHRNTTRIEDSVLPVRKSVLFFKRRYNLFFFNLEIKGLPREIKEW